LVLPTACRGQYLEIGHHHLLSNSKCYASKWDIHNRKLISARHFFHLMGKTLHLKIILLLEMGTSMSLYYLWQISVGTV
jgi:hypothetical protein